MYSWPDYLNNDIVMVIEVVDRSTRNFNEMMFLYQKLTRIVLRMLSHVVDQLYGMHYLII